MREHETSRAQLDQYDDSSEPRNSQQWNGSNEREQELRRYDDEEVVTKPWPPYHW
jgi:hypothetical protein